MLAARARSAVTPGPTRDRHLDQVSDKARQLVGTLDEIVWATNPRHDSLGSLISYFSLYADRFLALANIAWRLEQSNRPLDQPVNSQLRHQLFLVFKEALTNVVHHAGATEVRVRLESSAGQLSLTVADNGRGFTPGGHREGMDGIGNMRTRVERLGGKFELTSEPGRGTSLRCFVPA